MLLSRAMIAAAKADGQIDISGEHACRLVRDSVLFTTRRLFLVDKQGVTGKKVKYLSIPYKSVVRFSVESAERSFALYVRGDSMTGDGIDTGDLVVVAQHPWA